MNQTTEEKLNEWKRLIEEKKQSKLLLKDFCKVSARSSTSFLDNRKNWMFNGSPSGAKAGATFFSLIETCKANNIEPYQYLCAMLNRIRGCVTENDYQKLLPQFIVL